MPIITIDIQNLYQQQFGSKPFVVNQDARLYDEGSGEVPTVDSRFVPQTHTSKGGRLMDTVKGVEVWLPVKFTSADLPNGELYLPYSVVRVQGRKTIIKTPLADRRGSVKEQYNIDDYSITVKGFVIGDDRTFPEEQIELLKQLFETKKAVRMHNAITNIFIAPDANDNLRPGEQFRVVITDIELPEVEGGRKHTRPFVLQLESDSIFTLELE